jgi:preprotein translocase subunit SecD
MSTPTKPVKSSGRPGRTLAILTGAFVLLIAAVFIQGATAVRLGLDLRGGTSVALQPRIGVGETGKVTSEAIDQAVSIIRQRVNSLGVAESEVSSQGSGTNRQIVISVPGESGRRVIELVGQTAELRFRQVLAESSGVPSTSTEAPVATVAGVSTELNVRYAALDCTLPTNRQGTGSDVASDVIVACSTDGGAKYILAGAEVLGRQVSKATAAVDTTTGGNWFVSLTFNGEGTKAFGDQTARVVSLTAPQNQVAIVLDGLVVSAPRINEAIRGGSAQITGNFTQLEAQDLANVLKYGSLPLAFDRGEVQQVSPTLGSDQLSAGLLAGGLGLGLVLLYSILYYRGLGLVTVGSLTVAAGLIYLLVLLLGEWIGFTLTLAGIAGIIVAIGITADSFIVYFERIRDELREGKSLRSAVETGWVRARRTIVVADSVSIIAAVLLYFLAVGGVRGFAFTLGLTTLVDLLVIFAFTKPMMTILSKWKFYASGHPLSGLSKKSSGIEESNSVQVSTTGMEA